MRTCHDLCNGGTPECKRGGSVTGGYQTPTRVQTKNNLNRAGGGGSWQEGQKQGQSSGGRPGGRPEQGQSSGGRPGGRPEQAQSSGGRRRMPGEPSEAEAEPGEPSSLASEARTRVSFSLNPCKLGAEVSEGPSIKRPGAEAPLYDVLCGVWRRLSLAGESLARQRLAVESLARQRLAVESLARQRLAVESLARQRLAVESLARQRLAVESLARQRLAVECQA
ncbi:hypothetical protein CRENBAI_007383 [Crenichthys baileyi]|uniref:Uncharacterized protein n=1 Tax=Crenichthys baileyi TaxID=28760 RepID=A0AAV9SLT8_9TELE